jgi:outer membrane protein assembly factor BamE (lipoprotein component of BamABCDE complex)
MVNPLKTQDQIVVDVKTPMTGHARRMALPRRAFGVVAVAAACVVIGGCAEQVTKHGHMFRENDVATVQPGMGQDQVRMSLGSPTTTTTTGAGNVYYYISSTTQQTAFMKPKETDRQVMAVYFTETGTVDRVANYGLKDGKVFDYISRSTPAPGANDEGLLKQLFRNLGKQQLFGQ